MSYGQLNFANTAKEMIMKHTGCSDLKAASLLVDLGEIEGLFSTKTKDGVQRFTEEMEANKTLQADC